MLFYSYSSYLLFQSVCILLLKKLLRIKSNMKYLKILFHLFKLKMTVLIKIDGTHINYPVMKNSTPDYYLHRNFNKEYSYYGTPYLSDKSDTMKPTDNIVIYGHNMRDNTMFGDLSKYKLKEFFEKHRYIHFDTLVDLGKYEIICVFKTTPSKFDYQNYTVFDSSNEFNSYISKCKESEYYNTNVSCSYGDKLITLSTCEYSQENGRLVVVAKKVK